LATTEQFTRDTVNDKQFSEGLMHVAAWYRGTPGPKFTQITQHLYAPHPAIVSSRSPKQCTRKALHKIFYTFRYFPAPGRAAGRRSSL